MEEEKFIFIQVRVGIEDVRLNILLICECMPVFMIIWSEYIERRNQILSTTFAASNLFGKR